MNRNKLIMELKKFRSVQPQNLVCHAHPVKTRTGELFFICECKRTNFARELTKWWKLTTHHFNVKYTSFYDDLNANNTEYFNVMNWFGLMTGWVHDKKGNVSCVTSRGHSYGYSHSEVSRLISLYGGVI